MPLKLRSEVRIFAEAMERALRAKDAKRGDSWKRMRTDWLLERLDTEMVEFREVTEEPILGWEKAPSAEQVLKEGADVANFLMFIALRPRK